jgi:hypothetical protein
MVTELALASLAGGGRGGADSSSRDEKASEVSPNASLDVNEAGRSDEKLPARRRLYVFRPRFFAET